MIIRAAYQSDLAAIAAIQQASGEAAQWKPADYLEHDCRIAFFENRVAGFVVTRRTAPDECEVLNVAVDPTMRRQGIGRALLNAALVPIPKTKLEIVSSQRPDGDPPKHVRWYLEVRESNYAAIAMYETSGFQRIGRREKYYSAPSEAAIVMVLKS